MRNTKKVELTVGCFVLAAIVAILVLIFQIADVKSLGQGDTYVLKAKFDNIGSLKVRAPVKVGGVSIGRISAIDLDPASLIPIVTMSIDGRYNQFPETSSIQVLTSGLIGEQYLSLTPGFIFEDEEMLGDGDVIEDTKSALVLEDLIGQMIYRVGDES